MTGSDACTRLQTEWPRSRARFGIPATSGAPGESDVVAAVVFKPAFAGDDGAAALRAALRQAAMLQFVLPLDAVPKTASEQPLSRVLAQWVAKAPQRLQRWQPAPPPACCLAGQRNLGRSGEAG